jgi:hypothetical protein
LTVRFAQRLKLRCRSLNAGLEAGAGAYGLLVPKIASPRRLHRLAEHLETIERELGRSD